MAEDIDEMLLIEDSKDDVAFFTHTFEKSGLPIRLRIAADGLEAMKLFSGDGCYASRSGLQHLRAIILDLKMPRMDGLQVLQHLKSHPDLKTIPVVIFSSSQEESDLLASYKLGANSYIVKPMDFDQFAESVTLIGKYWLQFNQLPKP